MFETISNLRLISNFQNPNIHTQNKNLKARPTLFHWFVILVHHGKKILIVVFFASKFHQPFQSTPVRFKLYLCAFCSNLTSFTLFPKSEAINIHFIFEFTLQFVQFFIFFFRNIIKWLFQKSKTESAGLASLLVDKTRAPVSVSSASEQWHSRLACEEIGCVRQTFEFSDVILAPSLRFVTNYIAQNKNK